MKIRITLIFSFIIAGLLASAQLQVKRLNTANQLIEYGGVVYALPRAVIRVDVKIQETHHYKGPYAVFAEELLGLKEYVTQDYTSYQMLDFEINNIAMADPEQVFFASWDDKEAKDNQRMQVQLNGNGLIEAVGIFAQSNNQNRSINDTRANASSADIFELAYGPNLTMKIDTIIRIVTVDTSSLRKEFFNTRFEMRPEKEKAMDAAGYITQLRKNRQNLLSGYQEVAYSKESISYMNEELKKLINEHIALFRGMTSKETYVLSFYITPTAEQKNDLITLFKFSENEGITPASNPKGRDVIISFREAGQGAIMETFRTEGSTTNGFYYRIPQNVLAEIKYYGRSRKEIHLSIPQFGQIQQLPSNVQGILYDTKSGALKSVRWK